MPYYSDTTSGTSDTIWSTWSSTATTTSATGDYLIWRAWQTTSATATYTITTDTTTADIWGQWQRRAEINREAAVRARRLEINREQLAPQLTAEEIRRRAEVHRLAQEMADKALKESQEAAERAAALLDQHLSPEQRAMLKKSGEFEVESQSGKIYLIRKGRQQNVYSLDEHRKKTMQYCIHPDDNCPDQDTMLAQMLWLKWNEPEFLRIANKSRMAA